MPFFCFYLSNFVGDGSVCSTTSSTDNGDVDAFLLQVRKIIFSFITIIIINDCNEPTYNMFD